MTGCQYVSAAGRVIKRAGRGARTANVVLRRSSTTSLSRRRRRWCCWRCGRRRLATVGPTTLSESARTRGGGGCCWWFSWSSAAVVVPGTSGSNLPRSAPTLTTAASCSVRVTRIIGERERVVWRRTVRGVGGRNERSRTSWATNGDGYSRCEGVDCKKTRDRGSRANARETDAKRDGHGGDGTLTTSRRRVRSLRVCVCTLCVLWWYVTGGKRREVKKKKNHSCGGFFFFILFHLTPILIATDYRYRACTRQRWRRRRRSGNNYYLHIPNLTEMQRGCTTRRRWRRRRRSCTVRLPRSAAARVFCSIHLSTNTARLVAAEIIIICNQNLNIIILLITRSRARAFLSSFGRRDCSVHLSVHTPPEALPSPRSRLSDFFCVCFLVHPL